MMGEWIDVVAYAALIIALWGWEALKDLNSLLRIVGLAYLVGCSLLFYRWLHANVPLASHRQATLERRSIDDHVSRKFQYAGYGVMMIFFSREAIHDERVQDLKLKAINAAFSVSFTLTLIVNWFLNRDFDVTRDFNGAAGTWRSISAFDLIILTISTALVLFHVWRLQDSEAPAIGGRGASDGPPPAVRHEH